MIVNPKVSILVPIYGVEKILSVKANYLVDKLNYDVYIVTYNQQNRPIFFNFDKRIKIIDLDVGEFDNASSFIKRHYNNYLKGEKFIKKLEILINEIKPDITISVGGNEFFFVNKLKDQSIKLAEYHVTIGAFDVINANLKGKQKILSNLSFSKFKNNLKQYKKFIVLTKGDRKEWTNYSSNVISIPNPQTFDAFDEVSTLQSKVAIAVGRFEPQKQFDHLIILWNDVVKSYPDWILKLKGSGSEKQNYLDLIARYDLQQNVILEEPSHDMINFYKNASMYLMASTFEGFSLVMLEALELGLPIVAYDCKYGPSELVENNKTGFLVAPKDKTTYLNNILKLIENEDLRIEMGKNAKLKAKNYQLEKIMNKWDVLFKSLKND